MTSPLKILAVVGARLNSSRLPGKHMLTLAGRPMIERVFQRLHKSTLLNSFILATTDDSFNVELIDWARSFNVSYFAYKK